MTIINHIPIGTAAARWKTTVDRIGVLLLKNKKTLNIF